MTLINSILKIFKLKVPKRKMSQEDKFLKNPKIYKLRVKCKKRKQICQIKGKFWQILWTMKIKIAIKISRNKYRKRINR